MKNSYNNVASTTLLFLGILFFSGSSYSQDPWKAKIMFHSLNGYVDTLWIGCDEFGAAGYQPGLDIIDTTFIKPGGIWGFDPLIPSGECFNLKKDIKNFVSGFQTFNIKMADSLGPVTNYDYISIDTNDFKFDNGEYKITSVFMECITGYMIDIDLTSEYLYVGFYPSLPPVFLLNNINLIFEPGSYDCLPTNDLQMEVNVEIGFNYYIYGTSIEPIHQPKVSFYPNPAQSILFIKSEDIFNKITIYDQKGKIVYSTHLISGGKEYNLNLEMLDPGMYLLLLDESYSEKKGLSTKLMIQ